MATIFSAADRIGWQEVSAGLSLMLPSGENLLLGQTNPATDVNLVHGLFQAFVLGIVQGLTEFLPISSTAHLEVFTKALHWKTAGEKAFVASIQFGSVIAVLIYFWKDITKIFTGGLEAIRQKDWQRDEWKIIVGIAVGTLPILVGGFLLKDALNDEKSPLNSMTTIAIVSIVIKYALGKIDLLMVLVGTLSAFVFSYASIAWLLGYLQRRNTWVFVWYRLAFGAAILSAIAAGVLKNI